MSSHATSDLERRALTGDDAALNVVLAEHGRRLRRMVQIRLDGRVQARIGASDVIQEVYLEATQRLAEYVRNPTMPFFLWLRFIAGQKILEMHRRHLGAQVRDASREISMNDGGFPQATTAMLAAKLFGRLTSPSEAAVKAEMKIRLHEALDQLDPLDREIISLRHFEQLTNHEIADVLRISISGASSRYLRAIRRLKKLLASDLDFDSRE